jgi:hypothetical protein
MGLHGMLQEELYLFTTKISLSKEQQYLKPCKQLIILVSIMLLYYAMECSIVRPTP